MKVPGGNQARCRVTDGFVVRPGASYDSRIVSRALRKRRNQPDREAVECRGAVNTRLHARPFQAASERGDPGVGVCQH